MRSMYLSFLTVFTVVVAFLPCASAQVNDADQKPYLGWSSFSQQTIQGDFLTQANMITQVRCTQSLGFAGTRLHLYQSRFWLAGQLRPERATHSE
jgi:alpha-galactosidase